MTMRKILLVAFSALCATAFGGLALDNPAINPVAAQQTQPHPALVLVQDGKCTFRIIEEGLRTKRAAEALRRGFEKAGVRLVADADAKLVFRLVGDGDFRHEDFTLTTSAVGVTIEGNVLWGVYDFLERFLGARFYYAGEEGEVHPRVTNLTLEPCAYSDRPHMLNRGTYSLQNAIRLESMAKAFAMPNLSAADLDSWREANRIVDTDPFRIMHEPAPTTWSKAYTNMIPNLIETSFFQNQQGWRYHSFTSHTGNYFDVTSFDFVENLIKTYKHYYTLKTWPEKNASGFRYLNSKYIVFGQCDTERQLHEMQNHPVVKREGLITDENIKAGAGCYFSDVYARFYKRLAERIREEFPGKKLIVMPYNNYTRAPRQERFYLPDNVEIGVCLRDLPRFAANPQCIADGRKLLREWYRALGNRPSQQTWGYAAGNNYFTEAVAFNYEGVFIKAMGELLGTEGIFQEVGSNCGGVPLCDQALFHYEMYVMVRQMWNPDFNVRAALDEYFDLMYGSKAGVHLKAFYRLLVESFEKYGAAKRSGNALYPVTVLDSLEKELDAAKSALAEGDALWQKRFKLFESPFRYQIKAQRGRHAFIVPQTRATRVEDGAIAVDGRGDEAAWTRAVPAEMMRTDGTGEPTRFAPEVKFLWKPGGLYGLVVQTNAALKTRSDLWQNDTVEFFLAPGLDKKAYFQLAFDRGGHLHRMKRVMQPIPLAMDYTWRCEGMKSATGDAGDGWTLEFYLPFEAFEHVAPKPYESWNYLLVYNRMLAPTETTATSVTLSNNHVMNNYGVMKFLGRELGPTAGAPYAKTRRYKGYRENDHVFGASFLLENDVNFYGLDFLTYKPDKRGETETFFFMTDPRRYGGFGQASLKFLSLTVNGIPLAKTFPAADTLKTAPDGAPAYHLNFDGAGIVVEARQRKGDPLLYLTFRRDPASVVPIRSARIDFGCFVSCYDEKARYDRVAKTATREFGMSKDFRDRQELEASDKWLMLADRFLDGSSADRGFGPSLFRFQKDWRGVKGVSFCAPKTYNANVAIDLKPDFTAFTVGILQTPSRVANEAFERTYVPR